MTDVVCPEMFYSEVHHIIEVDIYDVFLLAQSLTNNISQTLETKNMYHNVKYEPLNLYTTITTTLFVI